jgi:hypothetical protein
MKNINIKNLVLLLAVVFALSSCAATKVAKDPHAPFLGNWEYVVEDLPVDIDGTMSVSKEEGVLSAALMTPMGDVPITDITITDGVLKAEFDAEGNLVELEGTFEGDTYKGLLIVQGSEFVMNAKKTE